MNKTLSASANMDNNKKTNIKHDNSLFLSVQKSAKKRRKEFFTPVNIIILVLLLVYAVVLMLPFYVIIALSITPYQELHGSLSFIWWPQNPTFSESYLYILTKDPIMRTTGVSSIVIGFLNTLWSVTLPLVISLFISGLCAYIYAKWDFKGKEVLFMLQLVTMMIPTACFTIPSFVFYEALGWTGTYLPLIIPGMFGSATTILFLRGYMTGIGSDVVEAARIDGLNIFSIYVKIMLPLSIPAVVAQFIFGFVGGYNSYTGPLLYLASTGDVTKYTLMLVITEMKSAFSDVNQQSALIVMAIIPLVLLYAIFQNFFIKGIAIGGGKE